MGQLAGQLGSLVAGQRRAANHAVGTVATWLVAYVAHTQQLLCGVRGLILAERLRGEGRLLTCFCDIRTVEAGAQRNVTHLYAGLSARGPGTPREGGRYVVGSVSTKASKRVGPATGFLLAIARDLRFSPRAIQQGNVGLLGAQNGITRSAARRVETPDLGRSYADPVFLKLKINKSLSVLSKAVSVSSVRQHAKLTTHDDLLAPARSNLQVQAVATSA